MSLLKLILLYVGGFFTVVFAALAIKFYKMPNYEYRRLQEKYRKKGIAIKNNKWTLF